MKIKIKIGDFLVIIFIIILSFGIFFASKRNLDIKNRNITEKYASIQVNGKEIKKVKLDKNSVNERLTVDTEYGHNILEFGDGCVTSIESDCPDQICVHQGTISRVGETIVCLPNRLVVEIVGDTGVDDIDLVN